MLALELYTIIFSDTVEANGALLLLVHLLDLYLLGYVDQQQRGEDLGADLFGEVVAL